MRSTIAAGLILAVLGTLSGCDNNSRRPTRADRPLKPTIDQPAPDIVGEDLDGKVFKLSEFRGKVVMLDFWGMWCSPCRMFLPHGKILAETYKDRPFVALGINTDGDPALPKSSKDLAMRCWSDPEYAIAKSWGVSGFPSVFLVDQDGVIRRVFEGFPRLGNSMDTSMLDDAIEQLVKQAEQKKVARGQ